MTTHRGRVSAAAKSVLATFENLEQMSRPEPPAKLTKEEAQIWRDTVDSRSPDYFPPETHALLVQYCRHVAGCDYLKGIIEGVKKEVRQTRIIMTDLRKTMSLLHRESKVVSLLATKMRLSQQSSYDMFNVRKSQRTAKAKLKSLPWNK